MLVRSRTQSIMHADQPYLGQLKEMPPSLIFIMGAHRSGTSLLYHLLANTGQFNYVSAYDIIKYDELLANRIHGMEDQVKQVLEKQITAQRKDRLIDGIPVGANLPEEYRFILFKEKINPLLQRKTVLFSPNLVPKNLKLFMELCQKKQFISALNQPLLLKNPNDFYQNFFNIHTLFPEAKFIFIHRHPLAVFNSNMAAWPLALKTKSEYLALVDRDYRRLFCSAPIERFVRLAFLRSGLGHQRILSGLIKGFDYYLENIGKLPANNHISIRYEDLCQSPKAALTKIRRFLDIKLAVDLPKQSIRPRSMQASPSVLACYEKRLGALRPYMFQMGYSPAA